MAYSPGQPVYNGLGLGVAVAVCVAMLMAVSLFVVAVNVFVSVMLTRRLLFMKNTLIAL